MSNPTSPRRKLRTIAWIFSILATLALVILTEFPLWGGLIITAVVILPCQIYLNRTKQQR